MTRPLRSIVFAVQTLLLVGAPGVARSTPGTGVRNIVLASGTLPDGVVIAGSGAVDVTVSEITIAPGGSTGWHYHDGQLIAVVRSGILTRTLHDCSTMVIVAGGSFVEPAGRRRPHVGRNLGTEPVVLLVTYVLSAGQPLLQDVPEPQHCQQ